MTEPKEISQTRPISNNNIMTKLLTSICNSQIRRFIDKNNLLSNFQSGFRNDHSCNTALIRVSEDIRTNIAQGDVTILVLLDIRSAYASVSHELLFRILEINGFTSNAISWIKCFLRNKKQCVDVSGKRSDEMEIKCGLIQGDNLSQTLFSLVINGVVDAIGNSKCHLYADDLCIYLNGKPKKLLQTVNMVNEDLVKINKWMREHGMQLNMGKTQPIIIGSKYNIEKLNKQELPRIKMDGKDIEYLNVVKYLGFHFNSHFTSENHVDAIVKRVGFALSQVKHRRTSLNTGLKLQLTRGIILPLFDYAATIYHGFNIHGSGIDEARINVLMNSCVRFVCNLTGRDHVSDKYIKLNLLNAFNRRVMLICCFIYNFIETKTPEYLLDIFKINNNATRAGKNTVSLVVKNVRLSRNEHLFAHYACKLWNSIPNIIRNSESKNIFSHKIKEYLMEKQAKNININK